MRQRLEVKRASPATRQRLLSAIFRHLPGAWIDPRHDELISLYRLRYRMAMDEQKYDTALIFLNKIIELDPVNVEAKLCKGEIYHRCLQDYPAAIEQYNKVIRLTAGRAEEPVLLRARAGMAEIMEMLS
jgi:tetratricopeptide (TPR) repeat protein